MRQLIGFIFLFLLCSLSAAKTLEQVVNKHGIGKVKKVIMDRTGGILTIYHDGNFSSALRPSTEFVTLGTLKSDMRRLGLSADMIEKSILAYGRILEKQIKKQNQKNTALTKPTPQIKAHDPKQKKLDYHEVLASIKKKYEEIDKNKVISKESLYYFPAHEDTDNSDVNSRHNMEESYMDSQGYKDYLKLPKKFRSDKFEEIYKNVHEAEQKIKSLPCNQGGTIEQCLNKKASIPAVEDLGWISRHYGDGYHVERMMLLSNKLKLVYRWNVTKDGTVTPLNGKAIGITKETKKQHNETTIKQSVSSFHYSILKKEVFGGTLKIQVLLPPRNKLPTNNQLLNLAKKLGKGFERNSVLIQYFLPEYRKIAYALALHDPNEKMRLAVHDWVLEMTDKKH